MLSQIEHKLSHAHLPIKYVHIHIEIHTYIHTYIYKVWPSCSIFFCVNDCRMVPDNGCFREASSSYLDSLPCCLFVCMWAGSSPSLSLSLSLCFVCVLGGRGGDTDIWGLLVSSNWCEPYTSGRFDHPAMFSLGWMVVGWFLQSYVNFLLLQRFHDHTWRIINQPRKTWNKRCVILNFNFIH